MDTEDTDVWRLFELGDAPGLHELYSHTEAALERRREKVSDAQTHAERICVLENRLRRIRRALARLRAETATETETADDTYRSGTETDTDNTTTVVLSAAVQCGWRIEMCDELGSDSRRASLQVPFDNRATRAVCGAAAMGLCGVVLLLIIVAVAVSVSKNEGGRGGSWSSGF